MESLSDCASGVAGKRAEGSRSADSSLRIGSDAALEVATDVGTARQWPGETLWLGAFSGHSPHGGDPSPGQQSPCWVAAAHVITGIATLNSEIQMTSRLTRR